HPKRLGHALRPCSLLLRPGTSTALVSAQVSETPSLSARQKRARQDDIATQLRCPPQRVTTLESSSPGPTRPTCRWSPCHLALRNGLDGRNAGDPAVSFHVPWQCLGSWPLVVRQTVCPCRRWYHVIMAIGKASCACDQCLRQHALI